MNAPALSNTPADVLKYQNELIRTGQALPLGKMMNVSIGPHKDCPPLETWDPIMKKYGRLIQFRRMPIPIAQTPNTSMILVPGILQDSQGRVRLPDLPNPDWTPRSFTEDEATGKVARKAEDDTAPMIEQSLRARAEGFLEDTNFYVFSPVLSIAFQPEGLGTFWAVQCDYNPADRTHPTLLIEAKTGEMHFFGGVYRIIRAAGEY